MMIEYKNIDTRTNDTINAAVDGYADSVEDARAIRMEIENRTDPDAIESMIAFYLDSAFRDGYAAAIIAAGGKV